VTVATLRPDSWNLPLFLHVLGALVVFGGVVAVATLGIAASRGHLHAQLLARLAFRAVVFLVLPGWILMRVGAEWILGKEDFGDNDPGWVGVGYGVSDGTLLLLVVLAVLAFLSARRGGGGRLTVAFTVLAAVCLVAFAVAWFAMSAKPGA
jgi:hypothetical protein